MSAVMRDVLVPAIAVGAPVRAAVSRVAVAVVATTRSPPSQPTERVRDRLGSVRGGGVGGIGHTSILHAG